MNAADRVVVAVFVLYVALLAVLPLAMDPQDVLWTFSEEGVFERASIVAWIAAAAVVMLRIRPLEARAWAFAALYLGFAAREADWHKAFTADSLFKTAYYRRTPAPFEEKLIAGIVALALLLLFVYVICVSVRFLVRERGWRSRAGAWLAFGLALLFVGKAVDRAPAILAMDYGIVLPTLARLYVAAFEEGLESFVPVILAWSAWVSQHERRYLSGDR